MHLRLFRKHVFGLVLGLVIGLAAPAPWAFDGKIPEPAEEAVPVLPAPRITLPCRIVSCHDGDTVTVEAVVAMNVRLLDCWAPELKDPGGTASRDALREVAVPGARGVVSVPLGDNLSKSLTLGRVLGKVSLEKVGDLSERQVKMGHARTQKP